MKKQDQLSARERQIMDLSYAKGAATATDVLESLPDPPSRNAVRTFLRILEEKGHIAVIRPFFISRDRSINNDIGNPTIFRGNIGSRLWIAVLRSFRSNNDPTKQPIPGIHGHISEVPDQ